MSSPSHVIFIKLVNVISIDNVFVGDDYGPDDDDDGTSEDDDDGGGEDDYDGGEENDDGGGEDGVG